MNAAIFMGNKYGDNVIDVATRITGLGDCWSFSKHTEADLKII